MNVSASQGFNPPQDRRNLPIGVFDSGLGGLRVLDRLMQTLPDEHFVYLGDTMHMPYGDKTPAQLDEYVSGCLGWLFSQYHVKMVVVACNTASAATPHLFRSPVPGEDVPFVDPVTPICRWLTEEQPYRRVGVMATPATVASNRYRKLLDRMGQAAGPQGEGIYRGGEGVSRESGNVSRGGVASELVQVACGNLASVIEAGHGDTPECAALIAQYLAPLQAARVEAIILGCTHYPYVMDQVIALANRPQASGANTALHSQDGRANDAPVIDVLDPSVFMALEAKRLLSAHALASPHKTGRAIAEVDYFVTAEPDKFYETSRRMPFAALAMKHPTVVDLHQPQGVLP